MKNIYLLSFLLLLSSWSFAQEKPKVIVLPDRDYYFYQKIMEKRSSVYDDDDFEELSACRKLFEDKGYITEKSFKLELVKLRPEQQKIIEQFSKKEKRQYEKRYKDMKIYTTALQKKLAQNTQSNVIILSRYYEYEPSGTSKNEYNFSLSAIDAQTGALLAYKNRDFKTYTSYNHKELLKEILPDFEEEMLENYAKITHKNPNPKTVQNNRNANITSDISQNIPQTKMQNPDAIAVIIGNTNYEKTKNVDFAGNDSDLMKKYLIQTLGYKEGNIFHLKDIHKSEFETFFGTEKNHKGKLFNTVKANKSEVFIYYSGHGVPSIENKSAYFAPVECDPNYVELSGYSLDIFYNNLAKVPAKSMTIVLDACFSGADIYENISPIVVKSKGIVSIKKGTLLTSCQGNEVSSWYNEKGHSLFTYFFLKAIHNKNADTDKNGQLTFQEIQNYISNKTEAVPYFARRLHGIEQNPTLQGEDLRSIFVEY